MAYMKKVKEENSNTITNPEDLKAFKQVLIALTDDLQIIEDRRECIKETIDEASGEYGVDKRHIRKLAKVMFKHNYQDIQEENEHFEFLYEAVVGGRLVASDPLEDSD